MGSSMEWVRIQPGFKPYHIKSLFMTSTATKFAIDKTLLERIEKIMPAYHHKRTYINSLLDMAVTRVENQTRSDSEDWSS